MPEASDLNEGPVKDNSNSLSVLQLNNITEKQVLDKNQFV